jgi:8-oxo-dGTP pyrophosphatase MutT (NUDIX family)
MLIQAQDVFGTSHFVKKEDIGKRRASYGLYIQDNCVLLVQEKMGGNYTLPGGGVEKSETLKKGLQREFTEETGLTIKISDIRLKINHITTYFYLLRSKKAVFCNLFFYSIKNVSGTLQVNGNNTDIQKAAFVPLKDLDTLQLNPSHKFVIDEYCKQR